MCPLKLGRIKFCLKKGRNFMFLPFFLFVASCTNVDLSQYGRVTPHSMSSQSSFTFSVSDQFLKKSPNSKSNKNNPKITNAESKLLSTLLKNKNYCINNYGSPDFVITSRQEKIYDMTFAHLIEKNYNARAITPRTYFGRCKKD